MHLGFEVTAAKSKKGTGEEAPTHAPMAPRGPGRTSPSEDQKKVRRQMARTAGGGRAQIEEMLAGLEPDMLQALWDHASEEQRTASDRVTQDAIATVRGLIMQQFQKWGMEPATASVVQGASDFQGGGMLHALWIKILEWIIGHNGYGDYADEYAFASLRPQGALKENTVDTSIQREAALLNEMDGATIERQREIVGELDAISRARTAAWEADREIDFGGAVVRDTLAPVVVAAVHTSSTDWLDEAAPEHDMAEIQRAMTAAASSFYTKAIDAVKADIGEYRIQAEGMARLVAGAYAPYIEEATDAFMRHALFLNRGGAQVVATTMVPTAEQNELSDAVDALAKATLNGEDTTELRKKVKLLEERERMGASPRAAINQGLRSAAAIEWTQDGNDYWKASQSGWFGTVEARQGGFKWTSVMNGVVLGSGMEQSVESAKAKAMDAMGGDLDAASSKRMAADADVTAYPANEQAGYAESGLPAAVPVEGYEAEGVGPSGAFENFAPQVAPENTEAEAKEGDHTPMPGFGEQVTSAVDAGMRSVDTPLWGFQTVAQQQKAAAIPETVGNGESYPTPCVVVRDEGRSSNYQYHAVVIWSAATTATVAKGFDKGEVLRQAQSYASNESLPLYDEGKLVQNPQALASKQASDEYEDDFEDGGSCVACGGPLMPLGSLGKRKHYRCRDCGLDQSSSTASKTAKPSMQVHCNSCGNDYTSTTNRDSDRCPSCGSSDLKNRAWGAKTAINWTLTHEEPNWVTDDGDVATTPNGTIPMEYVAKVPEGELRVYNVIGGWLWQINGPNPNAYPLVEFNGANGDPFGPRDGLGLEEAKRAVEKAYAEWSGKKASKTAGVSLTNVGFVGGIGSSTGKGTDPSGKEVHFRLSDADAKALASVLTSDLAINFSGIEVDQADIITQASKTAGTDPDDQSGEAESNLPTPEANAETMWPWELPDGETKSGQDAADVASVPTPGKSEADYPQPKGAARTGAILAVSTSADGFGNWHASVVTSGAAGDEAAATAAARDALREAIGEREGPNFDPNVVGVALNRRVSNNGTLTFYFDETNAHEIAGRIVESDEAARITGSRQRDIEPTEAVQAGDTVRILGGFEDGTVGKVTRGGWHESHAYGYTLAGGNAFAAYYIDVAGTEIGPFRAGDIEKV